MERVIENGDLGNIFSENRRAGVNALKVSCVMQRSQVYKTLYAFDYLIVYKYAFVKERTALHYSVTDSGDFGKVVYDLALAG